MSSCGFAVVSYLRFLYLALLLRLTVISPNHLGADAYGGGVEGATSLSPGKRARIVNTLSFLVALIMAALMALVACFDSSHYAAHVYLAYTFFALNVAYQACHAWLQLVVSTAQQRVELRNARTVRQSGRRVLTHRHAKTLLAFTTLAASVVALLMQASGASYSTTALFEYVMMLSILLFWTSIGADFYLFGASILAKIGAQSHDDKSRVIHVEDV
jgi:hypothetical protein